ncbi:DUF4238 domain-containing protein [Mucilaginibacter sp. ZT4R22]|uniref:DUF4238 domain-containing protein n=1 Tax=Mucilaginibacter pankratovii TaxID=2772110 RepID=A0ABR7WKX8_9SPHI|nr:DUF4238 domain-containing protein [Mucilaginibacter pankratovii]MBD1362983.1 DUF4238 domain-containing protein [Mucilaginibacter pankratovii]
MVKNQHYVPRFYLRQFENDQGQCWAFHKDTEKAFPTSVANIASEGYFYDDQKLDQITGVNQFVENYLGELEAAFSPFLTKFLADVDQWKIKKLDQFTREKLCEFIVFQIIRTKEHRESIYQGITQFQEQMAASGWQSDEMIASIRKDDTKSRAKKNQIEQIVFDSDFRKSIQEILNSHIWIMFKNLGPVPYYTSDHPVVKRPHINRPHRGDSGYRSKGIEIAIPLSATHLLVMFERIYFKELEYRENSVLVHRDIEDIDSYNSMQVSQSFRGIYCSSGEFRLAKAMVKEYPDLKNLHHQRFGSA